MKRILSILICLAITLTAAAQNFGELLGALPTAVRPCSS